MQHWIEIAVFTGKAMVIVFAIGSVLILFFALIARARHHKPLLSVENLNHKFDDMNRTLNENILESKDLKSELKSQKKKDKADKKSSARKKRIYYINFEGDIRATAVESLREEITGLLTVARPGVDEVVVNVESGGGIVHSYGLAAAQLVRVREAGIQLTVCVDKVAASGGYMMACVANKILASPFAIIGSIGVIAQLPNFHRLLKKHDVDYQEFTAGEFKRTITVFGEITEAKKAKLKEHIEQIHVLFKSFVQSYRPQLDLAQVATGEYWFGQTAKDLKLVDEIITSDDYLFHQRDSAHIYRIEIHAKKSWSEKLSENVASVSTKIVDRWLEKLNESRLT